MANRLVGAKTEGSTELGASRSKQAELNLGAALGIALSGVCILLLWLGPSSYSTALNVIGAIATLVCGMPIYRNAFRHVLAKRMTMELSMTIALLAALVCSEVLSALVIVFFVLIAEEIEKLTVERGRRSIRALLDLRPAQAEIETETGMTTVPAASLKVGDTIIVRPGSRIAVDGAVIGGYSYVDESTITGESMPAEKQVGSKVYAGSLNQSGVLRVQATSVGQDTAFGKIVAAVELAEHSRAGAQKTADKLSKFLVYFGIACALLTLLITRDVRQAVSVIVVTGACGVAAGTPLAILGAIGRAARRGSIIKGGIYLEQLSLVNTVALDKTGTVTVGKPSVVSITPRAGVEENEVLAVAAIAEMFSEHPVARAVMEKAKQAGLTVAKPERFETFVGRGVSAVVAGQTVLVGNLKHMAENGVDVEGEVPKGDGCTEVFVARNDRLLGRIEIADALRPEAAEAIRRLQRMGIQVVLLSGDAPPVVARVAKQLGISDFLGSLSPADKKAHVASLVASGKTVSMVGDGVNDAPALVESHVGVAIGTGTDVALESADIVLTGGNLLRFVETVQLARQWRRIVYTNLIGTIVIDTFGIALAFLGMLTPLLAAFIHVGSEVVFIANSARLFLLWTRKDNGTSIAAAKSKSGKKN